jgi:hypothetical protein
MSTPAGSPALFCQFGNKFLTPPGYPASDFLYGYDGPSPSLRRKGNPCAIAPQVFTDGAHGINLSPTPAGVQF